MLTFVSFKQFVAELNKDSFLKVIPEARVIFLIKSSVRHSILDIFDRFLDFLFGMIEISHNNFADVLPVVI